MRFIKNKTTNKAKCLLSSSMLILNGNMCNLNTPTSYQKALKPDSAYSSTMSNPEDMEKIQMATDLQDTCERLIDCCKEFKMGLLSQKAPSTENPPSDTTHLYDAPIYEEPIYDEPWDNSNHEALIHGNVDMDDNGTYGYITTQEPKNRHLVTDL